MDLVEEEEALAEGEAEAVAEEVEEEGEVDLVGTRDHQPKLLVRPDSCVENTESLWK